MSNDIKDCILHNTIDILPIMEVQSKETTLNSKENNTEVEISTSVFKHQNLSFDEIYQEMIHK